MGGSSPEVGPKERSSNKKGWFKKEVYLEFV